MTTARFPRRITWAAALLAALFVVATTAAPVRAQGTKGKQAKGYTAVKVFNMPFTKWPLRKFSGRVVLFVVFNVWSDKSVEPVQRLNELHDKFGPDGLTVLAVTEAEVDAVAGWIDEHGVQYPVSVVETRANEEITRNYAIPGHPWGFLIEPHGKVVWEGHPMTLRDAQVKRHFGGVRRPPRLPKTFAAAQALFDDGQWNAGRKKLLERAESGSLSKNDERWARGVAAWVVRRSKVVFEECEADVKAGRPWDAWNTYRDFTNRFAGLESVARAEQRMAEIRADPAAAADLEAGDYVARTRELIGAKKFRKARLRIGRGAKKYKGTRHAERIEALRSELPAK